MAQEKKLCRVKIGLVWLIFSYYSHFRLRTHNLKGVRLNNAFKMAQLKKSLRISSINKLSTNNININK